MVKAMTKAQRDARMDRVFDKHLAGGTVPLAATFADCTCYKDCGKDSVSGDWHQHEDDPCPVHPDAPMVG